MNWVDELQVNARQFGTADIQPRKGKPAEKRGRTTTGLKLKGQDSRVTEGFANYAFGALPEGVFIGEPNTRF